MSAAGEAGESRQIDFSARLDERPLSLSDFDIPGMGSSAEACGKNRLPEKRTMCPTGDAVRYEPHKCRRVGCPDCYQGEDREQAFRMVRELEAAARIREERPHAVALGPPKADASGYSIEDINTSIFRRGYRRMEEQCEIEGGYAVFHHARILDEIEERLRAAGYGPRGENGGYWAGVRDDALGLGDWMRYSYYSPHGHTIGFPGWIEPHEGEDFVVHKYDTLDDVESLLAHVRHLLSHRGVYAGEGRIQAVRPWGMMHHAAGGWDGAEAELSEERYESLSREIAELVGMDWSADEGLYRERSGECPECGASKDDFLDLWEVPKVASTSTQGGQEWLEGLSDSQRRFVNRLIDALCSARQPIIFEEDLRHPDDVAVMVDGDRPPPGGEE